MHFDKTKFQQESLDIRTKDRMWFLDMSNHSSDHHDLLKKDTYWVKFNNLLKITATNMSMEESLETSAGYVRAEMP